MTRFETASLTSEGGRAENEDAVGFRMQDGSGCWAIADGLGGHRGGAVASRVAVEAALDSFEENPAAERGAMEEHMARANRAVRERQAAEPELAHMRTTIAVLIALKSRAMWAHAGDTRVYWFRGGKIQAQTRDDSVPQKLVDAGEIPADKVRFHEDRPRLLKSLGMGERAASSFDECAVERGDAFLLASDGFWEWVTEAEMEADGEAGSAGAWVEKMAARVKERGEGDHDNYSAIAVRVCG